MSGTDERAARLMEAADDLHACYAEGAPISTSRLLNPLLDLWALASELGDTVTGPIEQLLTVYNGPRDLALPSELAELSRQLREALDPAMV